VADRPDTDAAWRRSVWCASESRSRIASASQSEHPFGPGQRSSLPSSVEGQPVIETAPLRALPFVFVMVKLQIAE
jgi:hypothetical protein